ncbi:MAG: hypothetical protein ACK4TA_11590 [Saprospiraceae bacterium]
MLSLIFSVRSWVFEQVNAQLQPVEQAFAGLSDPQNVLSFLQTPEFRLLTIAVAIVALLTISIHIWAWIKMLLDREEPSPLHTVDKRMHTPPSQNYVPKAFIWQSSRIGLVPEFGLIDHQPDEPEPSRGVSTPTRGGDLS